MIKTTTFSLLMFFAAAVSGALSGTQLPDADKPLSGQRFGAELHVFEFPEMGGLFSCPLWADEILCEPFEAPESCEGDFVSCIASAVVAADGDLSAIAAYAFRSCRACEDTTEPVAEGLADLARDVCEVSQCSFSVCAGAPVSKTLTFCRSDVELDACRAACAGRVGQ